MSVDALRGLAVLGMLLVNNSGIGSYVYPFLQHSAWNGFQVADQVYPCFLFIVGTSIALSLAQREPAGASSILPKILRRTVCLLLLGVLINAFPTFDLETLRLTGILQRIAVGYLFASLAALYLRAAMVGFLAASILVGYWLAMEHAFAPFDLSFTGNLAAAVDAFVFTRAHLYMGLASDPEGLLATLPSIATVLCGYLAGRWLIRQPTTGATALRLAAAGWVAVVAGLLWSLDFPINKTLWSSSYAVLTAGWSLLLLAACYQFAEVYRWRAWCRPLLILSSNALVIFAGSTLLERWMEGSPSGSATAGWIYHALLPLADRQIAPLLFSLGLATGWWLVAYALHRSGVVVRL